MFQQASAISHSTRVAAICCASVCLATLASAQQPLANQGATPAGLCAAAEPIATIGNRLVITIDARCWYGFLTRSVSTDSTVEFHIENKNPFLYTYRTTVQEQVVQEPPVMSFLGQISPLFTAAAAGKLESLVRPTLPERIARVPNTVPSKDCKPEATVALSDLQEGLRTLFGAGNGIQRLTLHLTALETVYGTLREQYQPLHVHVMSPMASTKDLTDATDALRALEPSQVAVDLTVEEIRALNTVIQARATSLVGKIDQFRKDHPACAVAGLGDARAAVEEVAPATASISAQLDAIKVVTITMRAMLRRAAMLTSIDFDEERVLRMPGEARDVEFKFERVRLTALSEQGAQPKPATDATTPAAEPVAMTRLRVGGGPRFVLSGGVGYASGLPNRRFQVVQGFEQNAAGERTGTALTTVVGYEENQTRSVLPVLLWNTRIVAPLFFSVGITAKVGTDVFTIDYLAGPSLAAFGNRVLVTGGWYYGRRPSLAGDLYVGAKVDAAATIATEKAYESGFAVVLSFKIK